MSTFGMARKFGQKNDQAMPSFGMGVNPAMNANKMYSQLGANELKQYFTRSSDRYGKSPASPNEEDYRVQISYVRFLPCTLSDLTRVL